MLWLDAEAVLHFGDFRRLVPAIQEMNRQGTDQVERMLLSQPSTAGGQNDWLMLPAWQHERCFGLKTVSVFPANAAKNIASVQGAYLLFDGQTGEMLCGLDGAMLTLRKTAANSAAASDWLARKDAETLCMVGAGALAPHLVEAHCGVHPDQAGAVVEPQPGRHWSARLPRSRRCSRRSPSLPPTIFTTPFPFPTSSPPRPWRASRW